MEGLSKITYKGKQIYFVDYAPTGGVKEKTIQLIKTWEEEFRKQPPKSVLALINTADLRFDAEITNLLKKASNNVKGNLKKNAFFGLRTIHQALFNIGFALSFNNVFKVFKMELEAKEWLVKD